MSTGAYISGLAHVALILWLLFGGLLPGRRPPEVAQVAEVTLLSSAEFAALTQPQSAPETAPQSSPPPAPPADESPPEQPASAVSPPAAPPARPAPAAPAPGTAPPEDAPLRPEAAPPPDSAPPDVAPPPAMTPGAVPEGLPEIPAAPGAEAVPLPAPRVAPEAAPPPPEALRAPEAAPAVRADSSSPNAPEAAERPETAPEQAATEIVTEAERPASAGLLRSLRPLPRPPRPAPEAPAAGSGPEGAGAGGAGAADPIAAAVAGALREAVSGQPPASAAPRATRRGPPLTGAEREGLRVAVQKCWNVGALSSAALATTVVVYVQLGRDGRPDVSSIRMLSSSGGSEAAARQAYEAARRAIIRCGSRGFDLPAEKYAQWKEIEMTFNPERMRIR